MIDRGPDLLEKQLLPGSVHLRRAARRKLVRVVHKERGPRRDCENHLKRRREPGGPVGILLKRIDLLDEISHEVGAARLGLEHLAAVVERLCVRLLEGHHRVDSVAQLVVDYERPSLKRLEIPIRKRCRNHLVLLLFVWNVVTASFTPIPPRAVVMPERLIAPARLMGRSRKPGGAAELAPRSLYGAMNSRGATGLWANTNMSPGCDALFPSSRCRFLAAWNPYTLLARAVMILCPSPACPSRAAFRSAASARGTQSTKGHLPIAFMTRAGISVAPSSSASASQAYAAGSRLARSAAIRWGRVARYSSGADRR